MAMRSHYCGLVTEALLGQQVTLAGWVNRRRDHGGVIFIDLRDHYGITQIVTDVSGPVFKVIEGLKSESVVTITGKVTARAPEAVNPNLPTGGIEIRATAATVQSMAGELPMPVDE